MQEAWWKRFRGRRLAWRRQVAAHLVSDRRYVSALYRNAFGRLPDLEQARGFNEKILVKILRDRRAYLTYFSDKLRVRNFVRRRAPALALPTLFWHSPHADTLDLDALPDAFMLKPNHGSGWLYAVEDKRMVRRETLVRLARHWLASDFSIVGREWSYRNIARAVYAESLLHAENDSTPADYKLFVFGGKVRLIQVDCDRFRRHTQVLYDEQWRPIAGTVKGRPGNDVPPPRSFATMVEAAQALSLGVDFVRVDLYDIDGAAYFGELTHYPNKGLNAFDPPSLDERLGDYLTLDDFAIDIPKSLYDPEVVDDVGSVPDARE